MAFFIKVAGYIFEILSVMEMDSRRAKRAEIWDSEVIVEHILVLALILYCFKSYLKIILAKYNEIYGTFTI